MFFFKNSWTENSNEHLLFNENEESRGNNYGEFSSNMMQQNTTFSSSKAFRRAKTVTHFSQRRKVKLSDMKKSNTYGGKTFKIMTNGIPWEPDFINSEKLLPKLNYESHVRLIYFSDSFFG